MKKLLSQIAITTMLMAVIPAPAAQADFLDVPAGHSNSIAINYLQENGVIEGYSDGTFRPQANINRVEFLKIIMEGSDVPLDQTLTTPFVDVDENAWYGPYVRKAYHEGWVVGYEADGTFRPAQNISKAEALKIIAVVQGWNTVDLPANTYFDDVFRTMWFAKYVSYAKENDFLEDITSNYSPNSAATRAYISEVIYRTDISSEELQEHIAEFETHSTAEPTPTPPTEAELTTIETSDNYIETNFFDGISLDSPIPKQFYSGEVYVLEGEITDSGSYRTATALLESDGNGNLFDFMDSVENREFSIPVHFNQPGSYKLGLIKGNSGTSKAQTITVLDSEPTIPTVVNQNPPVSNLNVKFEDGDTIINFSGGTDSIKKLHLLQGSREQVYISRQDLGYIPINYKDFEGWSTNAVTYYIETAEATSKNPIILASDYANSISKIFNPTTHGFSDYDITYTPVEFPETADVGETITISGRISIPFAQRAYYIAPDGTVDSFDLNVDVNEIQSNGIVNAANDFVMSFVAPATGNYQFEINDSEGIAVINHTVYVGNRIPLLPNYYDKNTRTFGPSNINLEAEREKMLILVNNFRSQFGLDAVVLDEELNALAQAHTNDMAANGYFGHINLQGETPDDRRLEAGITTIVGENLVKDVSLDFGHQSLLNSAIHRENILNPEWERVGIGITIDSDGYMLISQEFSSNPLTAQTLLENENEALSEINQLRSSENLSTLIISNDLSNVGQYINDAHLDQNRELNNELLSEALSANNITGLTQALLRNHFSWETTLNSLLEDESILDPVWESMGIDVKLDESGERYTIVVLNRQ